MGAWITVLALASILGVSGCSVVENALAIRYEWDGKPLSFRYEGSDVGLVEAKSAADEWNSMCPGVSISVSRTAGTIPLREMPSPARAKVLTHGADLEEVQFAQVIVAGDETGIVGASYTTSVIAHAYGAALAVPSSDDPTRIGSPLVSYGSRVTPEDCPRG